MQTNTTNLINSSAQADGTEQEHPIISSIKFGRITSIQGLFNNTEPYIDVTINKVDKFMNVKALAQDIANYPDCYPSNSLAKLKELAKGMLDDIQPNDKLDIPHQVIECSTPEKPELLVTIEDVDSDTDDEINTVEDELDEPDDTESDIQQEQLNLKAQKYKGDDGKDHTFRFCSITLEDEQVFIEYEVDEEVKKEKEEDVLLFANINSPNGEVFESIEEAILTVKREWDLASGWPNGGKLPITASTFTPDEARNNNLIDNVGRIDKNLTVDYITNHIRFAKIRIGNPGDNDEPIYKVYYFKDGIYRSGVTTLVGEILERMFPEGCTSGLVNEIIGSGFKSGDSKIGRRLHGVHSSNLDVEGWRCLNNCIIKLPTKESRKLTVLPHTPNRYFTKKLNVTYDPNSDTTEVMNFLQQVSNGPEMVQGLIEAVTWVLTSRLTDKPWILFMVGEGANGKSVYLKLIRTMLSSSYCSSLPLYSIADEHDRFRRSHLYCKLANICEDIGHETIRSTGDLKTMSGGGSVFGEIKNGGMFEFDNEAKLIFSTNRPPIIADDSFGINRRVRSFAWTHQFIGKDADPQIFNKLSTPQNLSALFNLAISAFDALEERGELSGVRCGNDILKLESESGQVFLEEECEGYDYNTSYADDNWEIEKQELFENYKNWCKGKEIVTLLGRTDFYAEVKKWAKENKYKVDDKQIRSGSQKIRIFSGLKCNYNTDKPKLENFIKDTSVGIQTA